MKLTAKKSAARRRAPSSKPSLRVDLYPAQAFTFVPADAEKPQDVFPPGPAGSAPHNTIREMIAALRKAYRVTVREFDVNGTEARR